MTVSGISDFIIPGSSASGSRGRARPCRTPWPPGHRPGRTAPWWHCSGSVCHLPGTNKDNIQHPPLMQHDLSPLWHTPSASGVKPAATTNHKRNPQQCKWLEATACVVFVRAPFGSESLENVSFEEMHQVEREATATSRQCNSAAHSSHLLASFR